MHYCLPGPTDAFAHLLFDAIVRERGVAPAGGAWLNNSLRWPWPAADWTGRRGIGATLERKSDEQAAGNPFVEQWWGRQLSPAENCSLLQQSAVYWKYKAWG